MNRQHVNMQQMMQRLALSGTAPDSPFVADATPFFNRCEDELMSLHHGGRMGLMDLFNWEVTDTYLKTLNFITYVRPEMSGATPTAGHLPDPCADPNTFEFGTSELAVTDFGRYGRKGPVREIMKPTKYCDTDPIYRLDGTPITSEFEWDMAFAMDVIKQDLFRDIIIGNKATAGKMDGIQQWIKTGYNSAILDSRVIDWAGNDMDGAGGGTITVNGTNYTGNADVVDFLLALYREFRQRITWSPQLATSGMQEGGIVLVLPTFLARCLLDKFTCWSVCPGRQYNETNLQTYEARNFRDSLNGGMFGAGSITLDGDTIHLFPYDWETMHGTNRGDMYFMTLNVGSNRIWSGEQLSAGAAAAEMSDQGHDQYFSTDGGRILGTTEVDNLCRETKIWVRPRIWCRAPYLQARIMDVECVPVLNPLSPDPIATSFYPVTSFGADKKTV